MFARSSSAKTESVWTWRAALSWNWRWPSPWPFREYQARQAAPGELLLQERMDLSGKDDQGSPFCRPWPWPAAPGWRDRLPGAAAGGTAQPAVAARHWASLGAHASGTLTQGWGTGGSAVLAEEVLQRLGYSTERARWIKAGGADGLGGASRVPQNLQLRQPRQSTGDRVPGLLVCPLLGAAGGGLCVHSWAAR